MVTLIKYRPNSYLLLYEKNEKSDCLSHSVTLREYSKFACKPLFDLCNYHVVIKPVGVSYGVDKRIKIKVQIIMKS